MKITKEHLKLGYAAYHKYKKYVKVPQDELESCVLIGIFHALRTYDPTKAALSVHIFNKVKNECLKYRNRTKSFERLKIDVPKSEYVAESYLPAKYDILYDKMVAKMSVKELAERYNLTPQEVRAKTKYLKQQFIENNSI